MMARVSVIGAAVEAHNPDVPRDQFDRLGQRQKSAFAAPSLRHDANTWSERRALSQTIHSGLIGTKIRSRATTTPSLTM